MSFRWSRRGGFVLAASLLLLLPAFGAVTIAPVGGAPRAAATGSQPNIVLILTDDQRSDEMANMPIVQSELVAKGDAFSNAFVVNPRCCPSRTTILTGKYSHSTDIYRNLPPHGGFQTFVPEESSTIATWLHDSGYQTGLVGKYLNGYAPTDVAHVATGWDTWDVLALANGNGGDGAGGYYNYTMSIDGTAVSFGHDPSTYSTDVLSNYATSFINSVPSDTPLFLWFAPRAPHDPATPPQRYINGCPGYEPIRLPSYNETDVSDKPAYVQALPVLDTTGKHTLNKLGKKRCRSLLGVDDAVGNILNALQQSGRLSNTMIVFMSDNGYELGEHRWRGKYVPWEESIHVPMVVRYDPLTQGQASTSSQLVLNMDLTSTFADIAGVSAPGAEGTSLVPLLDGTATSWRSDFLIEDMKFGTMPTYCGVRTDSYAYVVYQTGEEELYDLSVDPYEMQSVASDPNYASTRAQLRSRLAQLCVPPPPGFKVNLGP